MERVKLLAGKVAAGVSTVMLVMDVGWVEVEGFGDRREVKGEYIE
jgi:hypothetical protein